MYDFEFLRATTLDEAVAALADDDAQLLAGGQTLIPTMKARLAAPSTLISLSGIPKLSGVHQKDKVLTIGAATTHATVARDAAADFPALAALASQIGDPAVRNRGTIGGSLANNDPSGCYPAAALGSDATIITTTRELSAGEFFDGLFATVLEDDEIIVAVRFPIPDAAEYAKMPQPASRFAMAGAFVARFGASVRVAITGAGEDGVFRWTEAEKALESDFSQEALKGMTVEAGGMIGDIHAAPDYRAHLVAVMTQRAVAAIS